jgi:hypothetical protein
LVPSSPALSPSAEPPSTPAERKDAGARPCARLTLGDVPAPSRPSLGR